MEEDQEYEEYTPYSCWMWLVEDGEEWGVIAAIIPAAVELGPRTLMNRKRSVAENMRPFAVAHGKASGLRVRLAYLTESTFDRDMDIIEP